MNFLKNLLKSIRDGNTEEVKRMLEQQNKFNIKKLTGKKNNTNLGKQ